MIKEIGSIFPLHSVDCSGEKQLQDERVYMSLCREALLHIARQSYANKVVLMPAFTCDTVYIPFLQEGWTLRFYAITKELRINTVSLHEALNTYHPSIVIAHPYFGYDFNKEEINSLSQIKDAAIIIDNTQCAFTSIRYPFADYTIASLRKWGPIPDGAYAEGLNGYLDKKEHDSFLSLQKRAMELRKCYFETEDAEIKAESIRLNKLAESSICSNMEEHIMSAYSQSLYANWDIEFIIRQRIANYTYLHKHMMDIVDVKPVRMNISGLTTAPLYYPIYCEDRAAVQKKLAEESIYCPIIWPVENDFVLIDDDVKPVGCLNAPQVDVKYIYDHILCLIVDQRYDEADMQHILDVLK